MTICIHNGIVLSGITSNTQRSAVLIEGSKIKDTFSEERFEKMTGATFPDISDIANAKMWLSKIAESSTVGKKYKFTSKTDVVEYLASYGTQIEGGKERIQEAFSKITDTTERVKILAKEYGEGGFGFGVLDMNWSAAGVKANCYINDPLLNSYQKTNIETHWF